MSCFTKKMQVPSTHQPPPTTSLQQQQQRHNVYQHTTPSAFRRLVREYQYSGPTNGVCLGYMQCHLVVLDISLAMDFIAFCEQNTEACPLLEICVNDEYTMSYIPNNFASSDDVDLRTDLPKYSIYRNGEWERDTLDVINIWPEHAVAFLIGSSFSYHGALNNAGIPMPSNDVHQTIPHYVTSIPCHPVGPFRGNVVVSMTPIPCTMVSQEVLISNEYPFANGAPLCIGGDGSSLGIVDLNIPDCGSAITIPVFSANTRAATYDVVPVFHYSAVTVQQVLLSSNIPFAISSAVGCMLVTDRPSP